MSEPRIHPDRLSAADRSLFEALDSLDHAAMRRALLDGADTEATDMGGCSPLYFLQAYSFSHDHDTPRLVALCAETLLEAGADPFFFHTIPNGGENEDLCRSREHRCSGCPLSHESGADDSCAGFGIYDFVLADFPRDLAPDDFPEDFPEDCAGAFAVAFLTWLRRHNENPALLSELRSALAAERVAIALDKGTLPGNTERGPWRGPRP
jgi:hypothetical protein